MCTLFTNSTSVHKPYFLAYLIKFQFDDSIKKFVEYRFETDLRELYFKYLKNTILMKYLSPEKQFHFKNANLCNMCSKAFQSDDKKVRNHCNITGNKIFGAAHSKCNLNYKDPNFIPIILPNLSGYDCHLFIKQLCSHGGMINVIAQNKKMCTIQQDSLYA